MSPPNPLSPFPDFKPRPAGAKSKISPLSDPRQGPSVFHAYTQSFDGLRLFYSTEGAGEPMIFCYGLVCSSLHWTYQIDYFAQKGRAIWFDYRGHQSSEVPRDFGTLTLENMARDLHAIIETLGLKKANLLGHSMGVNVVLEYYRQHPDRVKSLVLANGTPKRPLETIFKGNFTQAGFALFRKLYDRAPNVVRKIWKTQKGSAFARMMITFGGFNPHLTAASDIGLYVDQVADMDPGILLHLIENYDAVDMTPWLHTIDVPTLIIAGREDKITPLSQQELMHQLIPGSQFEVINHGSHCPQMDLPELINAKIEKFLNL